MILYTKMFLVAAAFCSLVACNNDSLASDNWIKTAMYPEFSDLEKACLAGDRSRDSMDFGGSEDFKFEQFKLTLSTQLSSARHRGTRLSRIFPELEEKDVGQKQCGMMVFIIQEDISIPWITVHETSSKENLSKAKIKITILNSSRKKIFEYALVYHSKADGYPLDKFFYDGKIPESTIFDDASIMNLSVVLGKNRKEFNVTSKIVKGVL